MYQLPANTFNACNLTHSIHALINENTQVSGNNRSAKSTLKF